MHVSIMIKFVNVCVFLLLCLHFLERTAGKIFTVHIVCDHGGPVIPSKDFKYVDEFNVICLHR